MSSDENLVVQGYEQESAALMFVRCASRPFSGMSTHTRADSHKVADKLLAIDGSPVVAAHVVYGPSDIIALVVGSSNKDRVSQVSKVRSLRNDSQNTHDFVLESESQPIISMYGRIPSRSGWIVANAVCGWMFAKVSETGPAHDLAERLLRRSQITFVATLTGHYDIAVFIEESDKKSFDRFIDNDIGLAHELFQSDTRLLTQASLLRSRIREG